MSITQSFDSKNKKLVITITGSFNFSEYKDFRNAYKNIPPDKNIDVSVNLAQAEHMDSAALGMLLLLDEHFKDQCIKIINCSDYIKQALDIVNFGKKFNIS